MSISGLLDTSKRSLNTNADALRILGDNIANVNTPGYTRRRADIVTQRESEGAGLPIGAGAEIDRVVRLADQFLNSELVARIGDRAKAQIKEEFLKRAEAPFQLDGEPGRIGYQFNEFFGALEDLAVNPADIPLRTQVLQKGNDLVVAINESFNQTAQLQREADDRIQILVQDVNRLTRGIAQTNFEIQKSETGDQQALTLRDQRDQLMRELGELVSFSTLENSDGQVLLSLQNGFALVNGDRNYELETTPTPNGFGPVGGYPPGLDGVSLSHIVYDFGGGAHADISQILRAGSGEIAGLLELRGTQPTTATNVFDTDGVLSEMGARIEHMTRDLLTRFNLSYLATDEDPGTAGSQPGSLDLDGNTPYNFMATPLPHGSPGPFALFGFNGAAAANNWGDLDADGVPGSGDLNNIVAAGTVATFAGNLTFNVTNERRFAAARDLNPAPGATTLASGDASNIEALLSLRNSTTVYSGASFSGLGSFSATTSIEGLYGLTVSYVGGQSRRASDDNIIFADRETQLKELQSSFSGVNLDEEFAQLINFQKGFEASARLVRLGDELFTEILSFIG